MMCIRSLHKAPLGFVVSCFVVSLVSAQAKPSKQPNYVQPELLHIERMLPSPPAADSVADRHEFRELLRLQKQRTAAEVAAAKADDEEEDIFIFWDVMGSDFTKDKLPAMALLSARLKNDSEMVDPQLKHLYRRPRPYVASSQIHPICALSQEPSYPSGHAMLGYLFAFALSDLVPEKHDAILHRADEYAQHRLVCGVHYRSDVEASRFASGVLWGAIIANAALRRDLDAARAEMSVHKNSRP